MYPSALGKPQHERAHRGDFEDIPSRSERAERLTHPPEAGKRDTDHQASNQLLNDRVWKVEEVHEMCLDASVAVRFERRHMAEQA
jgi:hypothetical protein